MINNPEQVLSEFKHKILNLPLKLLLSPSQRRKFRGIYYRACLVDLRCKKAKDIFFKGNDKDEFLKYFNIILNTYTKDPKARDDQAKKTLMSLMQHHINNHSGKPPTALNLENIERDLNEVLFDIFQDTAIKAVGSNAEMNSSTFQVSIIGL